MVRRAVCDDQLRCNAPPRDIAITCVESPCHLSLEVSRGISDYSHTTAQDVSGALCDKLTSVVSGVAVRAAEEWEKLDGGGYVPGPRSCWSQVPITRRALGCAQRPWKGVMWRGVFLEKVPSGQVGEARLARFPTMEGQRQAFWQRPNRQPMSRMMRPMTTPKACL